MHIDLSVISNLLKSSLFTAVLAGFTALSGFYVTHVVEELRSGQTATYYFERDHRAGTTLFHLSNISRSVAIEEANIIIKCRDQRADCFLPLQQLQPPAMVLEVTTPPNLAREIDGGRSGPAAIEVCLSAIPSSTTAIEFSTNRVHRRDLMVLYDPWSKDCAPKSVDGVNLLLMESGDIHAFFARNYFNMVALALVASASLLLFAGVGVVFQKSRAQPEGGEDGATDKVD